MAAETTVQTAKTKQAETSSPMQATEEVTLQNFPVFENLQVQQQPPPVRLSRLSCNRLLIYVCVLTD